MARPGRPERNRTARSFRQLRRFHHVINSNRVFGTHRQRRRSHRCAGFTSSRATNLVARRPERSFIPTHTPTRGRNPIIATAPVQSSQARARGKIPIAPTAPSVPPLPRFRALALFGRRPPVPGDSFVIPASENLHTSGLMHRSRVPPFDHLVGIGELLGQPRFPKALNEQLRPCQSAPGDQRRYCKGGIKLKHTHRRLTRLSIASEMGESGRETAVSYRKGGVVALSFLPCHDGLVKATELDKGQPHQRKRVVKPRVDRAHANGTFKASERFLPQPRNSIDLASAVPCLKRIWVERNRPINQFDLAFTIADGERSDGAGHP